MSAKAEGSLQEGYPAYKLSQITILWNDTNWDNPNGEQLNVSKSYNRDILSFLSWRRTPPIEQAPHQGFVLNDSDNDVDEVLLISRAGISREASNNINTETSHMVVIYLSYIQWHEVKRACWECLSLVFFSPQSPGPSSFNDTRKKGGSIALNTGCQIL